MPMCRFFVEKVAKSFSVSRIENQSSSPGHVLPSIVRSKLSVSPERFPGCRRRRDSAREVVDAATAAWVHPGRGREFAGEHGGAVVEVGELDRAGRPVAGAGHVVERIKRRQGAARVALLALLAGRAVGSGSAGRSLRAAFAGVAPLTFRAGRAASAGRPGLTLRPARSGVALIALRAGCAGGPRRRPCRPSRRAHRQTPRRPSRREAPADLAR